MTLEELKEELQKVKHQPNNSEWSEHMAIIEILVHYINDKEVISIIYSR